MCKLGAIVRQYKNKNKQNKNETTGGRGGGVVSGGNGLYTAAEDLMSSYCPKLGSIHHKSDCT